MTFFQHWDCGLSCKFVFGLVTNVCFVFAVSKHFLGSVAKSFVRRLTCQGGATITYLPASNFINMRKCIHYYRHAFIFCHLCTLHFSHVSRSFSFRWSLNWYEHAADTLACISSHWLVPKHTLIVQWKCGLMTQQTDAGLVKSPLHCQKRPKKGILWTMYWDM